jgi:hypothetical protein
VRSGAMGRQAEWRPVRESCDSTSCVWCLAATRRGLTAALGARARQPRGARDATPNGEEGERGRGGT